MSGLDAFSLGSLERGFKVAPEVVLARGPQGERGKREATRQKARLTGLSPTDSVPRDWSSFGEGSRDDSDELYDIGALPEGCGLFLSLKDPSAEADPSAAVDSILTMTSYGPVLKKVPSVQCRIVAAVRAAADGCRSDAEAAEAVTQLIEEARPKGPQAVRELLNQRVCNAIFHGRTALIQAVIGCLPHTVNVILAEDMDPNLQDVKGDAAVHHAARLQDTAIADALLDHPTVDWSIANPETEETMLHLAAQHGHVALVQRLVSSGAVELDSVSVRGTPLMVALLHQQWAVAELLLDSGASVEGSDEDSATAVMVALQCNASLRLLERLIGERSLKQKDNQGYTALHYAARDGSVQALQLVYEKGDVPVEARSSSGMTPFLLACSSLEKMQYLESVGASDSVVETATELTALHMAAMKGYNEGMELFLDRGFDINAATSDGLTPLMLAAMTKSCTSVPGSHLALLVSRGAELEACSSEHLTPLCYAVLSGYQANVVQLLSAGANVKHLDDHDQTPLHLSVKRGLVSISVQLLLEGSSWSWADKNGKLPADMNHPGLVNEIRKQTRVHRVAS
mmetsp:Transcript_15499/g.60621  ORF Transcript_15499/g.60621 Transcript_15499/m.60621 type:complete len:571 (+) Transcript_15499:3-1715(+)